MGQGNKNLKRTWTKSNKNKESNLEKEINKLKKPGKTYTKAQLLALKRKAQGKTISQVKSENQAAMRKRAAEKNKSRINELKIKKDKKKRKNLTGVDSKKIFEGVPKLKFLK